MLKLISRVHAECRLQSVELLIIIMPYSVYLLRKGYALCLSDISCPEEYTFYTTEKNLFLGYPSCCVEKYEKTRGMGLFYRDYLFDESKIRYNEINRLCTLFDSNLLMPDFFPCSLSCRSAKEFFDKIIEYLFDKIIQYYFKKCIWYILTLKTLCIF